MKRKPITINESGNIIIQTINPSEIWMNEPELISFLTSSLKKHKFHNCLANIVLYLCVT